MTDQPGAVTNLQIVYQVSQEDFESASWLALRKGPLPKALQFYFRIGFLGLWVSMSVLPVLAKPTIHNLLDSLMFSSFGFAILLGQLFFTRLGFRREFRRSAASQQPTQLGIDDSGLHLVTAESDSRSSWRLYLKFAENRSTFIVYQMGNLVFIPIPKRELTATQIDGVRSILSSHLPRK